MRPRICRPVLLALAAALLALSGGCAWVQGEFMALDRALPEPPAPAASADRA